MFNYRKIALLTAISCGLFLQATPASAQRRITCESYKGRYNYCRVNTRGGVKLRRRLSDAKCIKGRTWGFDRGGIWVDRGCSAEFALRGRGNYNPDYNYGRSDDNLSAGETAAIIGGVLVVTAIASAISSGSDNNDGNNFTCNSQSGRYTRCNLDLRRGDRVYLKRQLSSSGCWEGDTWGYDRDGIWVDQGCRGEFEIMRR